MKSKAMEYKWLASPLKLPKLCPLCVVVYFFPCFLWPSHFTHLSSTLSLVILTDGLQAPNLSGKDDLHHQIGHQSYESKNEFGIPSFGSYFYIHLNDILCIIWGYMYMITCSLASLFSALQTCGPDCGKVYQKGETSLSKSGYHPFSPHQTWINPNLFSISALSSVSLSTR